MTNMSSQSECHLVRRTPKTKGGLIVTKSHWTLSLLAFHRSQAAVHSQ